MDKFSTCTKFYPKSQTANIKGLFRDMGLFKKSSHRYYTGIYAFFILVFAITLSLFYSSRCQKSTRSEKQDTDVVKPEDSSDILQKVTKKIDVKKGQPENNYVNSDSDVKVHDENESTEVSKKDDLKEPKINIDNSRTAPDEAISPKDNQTPPKDPSISSRQDAVIYFSAESTGLTDEALEKLKAIYLFVMKYPDEEIIVEGYGDSSQTDRNDEILSKLRTTVVKDYFIKRGILNSRIKACWMGSGKSTECSVSKRDKNKTHQVEIKLKPGSHDGKRSDFHQLSSR
jgi:outer membrane protein OmpA-like peptidoglycan-associated protein